MIDASGPNGEPLALFESGAILLYLADKTGLFIPPDPALRWETIQWLFFQMASIGPMFGQVVFVHKFSDREIGDMRPLDRYVKDSKSLLGVLDVRLKDRRWILGEDDTIAVVATLGWVNKLITFHEAQELADFGQFEHVSAWTINGLERPPVQLGPGIPGSN